MSVLMPEIDIGFYFGLALVVVFVPALSAAVRFDGPSGWFDREDMWTEIRLYFLTHFLWLFLSAPVAIFASGSGIDGPALAAVQHTVAVVGAVTTLVLRRTGTIPYPELIVEDVRKRDGSLVVFGVVFAMTWTHLSPVFSPVGVALGASSLVCALVLTAVHRRGPEWRQSDPVSSR